MSHSMHITVVARLPVSSDNGGCNTLANLDYLAIF